MNAVRNTSAKKAPRNETIGDHEKLKTLLEGHGIKIFLNSVGGKRVLKSTVIKGELKAFNLEIYGFNVHHTGGLCRSYIPKKGIDLFREWLLNLDISNIVSNQSEIELPPGIEFEAPL